SLDGAILPDDALAEGREARAAAARAAEVPGDDRLPEPPGEVVHQEPRAPVRHAQGPAGGGDGAVRLDHLEQADLPRPESAALPEIHPHGEPRHAGTVTPSGRARYGAARP